MRRILSLDGGGMRSFMQALMLQVIEVRAMRPVHEAFDLIVGTSGGGIVASWLAMGLPATEIADLFGDRGPEIFRKRRFSWFRQMFGPKYDTDRLSRAFRESIGGEDRPLTDANTRLMLTSYDMVTRTPHFFRSWEQTSGSVPVSRAVAATSAAPTYFDPVEVGNMSLIDGGVFANDPSMVALTEAVKMWGTDERFHVVSLGTGRENKNRTRPDGRGWGVLKWGREVINVLMDGVSDVVATQLRHMPVESDRLAPRFTGVKMDDASPEALALMNSAVAHDDALMRHLARLGWDLRRRL